MKHVFTNRRISALLSVVPKEERCFDDEYPAYKLTKERARRLKTMMGLDRHRIAPPDVCSSDLCLYGLRWLLKAGVLKPNEIGALIFISQTPDYRLPPTSNVIQGELGLGQEVICLDINQGCAGFPIGLMQAFLLLQMEAVSKVVLLNGDTCSKQLHPSNRVSFPLVGDAGSVAVIERCAATNPIWMDTKMDGSRHQALIIPGGGYRKPSSPQTLEVHEVENGVTRSLEHIHMDGAAIFNFTMEDIPPQIEELLAFSGHTRDSVDYFLFHQPNQFILKQLADKLGISSSKLPNNVVGCYGNCSSVSVPLDIAHNCGPRLEKESCRVCLSAFGVGLAWSSMIMDLGPLTVCKVIEFESA